MILFKTLSSTSCHFSPSLLGRVFAAEFKASPKHSDQSTISSDAGQGYWYGVGPLYASGHHRYGSVIGIGVWIYPLAQKYDFAVMVNETVGNFLNTSYGSVIGIGV
jgi:hypothetical protein